MSELRFDGKSVIVTGGGRGFGRSHAMLLASRGAKVVVADYGVNVDGTGSSPEPAELVAKEIVAAGGEAVPCFASVAEEQGANSIVATALDAFGGLDVVINNAGICDPHLFEDMTMERFRRMVDFHYLGTVLVTKAAWPHLVAAPFGRIVNTASEAILGNVPKSTAYSAAKGAVFSFTRALALDSRRCRVRVNAVAPRGITRMSQPAMLARVYDQPEEDFVNPFYESLSPEGVTPAVAYLAHESCPLNGELLICGGGRALRLAVVETRGITREVLTPEDIAENLDAVMDAADPQVCGLDMPTP
jgi:NAD(P)-dependent dehydrogenase (short-subunit alcohol dehydrogenase family)